MRILTETVSLARGQAGDLWLTTLEIGLPAGGALSQALMLMSARFSSTCFVEKLNPQQLKECPFGKTPNFLE
jgi:hypothetical protein